MIERPFSTAAGVGLNIASSRDEGPPVVLLHGVTRRWQDWLTVLPALSPRWRAFAFDLRGHGRSDRTPGAYRIADYVPDVVDFLRRGVPGPAILIGHSLGGNIAAAVAAEVPELVRALVLEDPPFEAAGPEIARTGLLEMFRAFLPHAGSNLPVGEIAGELAEARVRAPGSEAPVRLGDVRDPVSLRSSAAGLARLDPEVLETPLALRWLEGSDVRDQVRRIACPTLLLQADARLGGLLTDTDAEEVAGLGREILRIKLDGVGHNIHTSAPDAMMRLVLPFLGSIE